MNARELAERAGVTERTIRNMIKRGDLKAEKKGKEYDINIEQANELILANMYKDKMASVLGDMGVSLSKLESEKIELSERMFTKFEEVLNADDKHKRIAIFENSGIFRDLENYNKLVKEIKSTKDTIKFITKKIKSVSDKDIADFILSKFE